jgi:hypothetical protein
MSNKQIMQRLDSIQRELDELRKSISDGNQSEWRAVAGTFANDPLFDKAMKYGAEYRRAQRPKSKRRTKRQ